MLQNLQYFLIPFMDWQVMALVWAGVFAGIWVGALPGLSGTMAVSLLISFTFSWELNNALARLRRRDHGDPAQYPGRSGGDRHRYGGISPRTAR